MNITASDAIAALAVSATMLVAWIAHLDRKGDHEHARTLAREARLQERRAVAYRDMLAMVFRAQVAVDQTLPLFERVPPPPRIPEPSIEEQRDMEATVAAFGSGDVIARLRAVISATRDFYLAASYLSDVRSIATPSVGGADELRKARDDLDARRAAFHAAVAELERVAREELAS